MRSSVDAGFRVNSEETPPPRSANSTQGRLKVFPVFYYRPRTRKRECIDDDQGLRSTTGAYVLELNGKTSFVFLDHGNQNKMILTRITSDRIMNSDENTTLRVAARPTPNAPCVAV